MTKEVNINLGDKGASQEKGRSCFDGVCPPNPYHMLDGIESVLPMILGLVITMMKMDQFNRPLANTAMQMIEGLAPQIEKNASQVGEIINSLTEASRNVAAKVDKHAGDFTKEDKVQLVQMLINDQNNYFDSYDSVLDFLNYQNPGFIKALYKTLLANMKDEDKVVHANSTKGKANIKEHSDPNRKEATTDRYTDLHDNLLDGHIAKAKKSLALSTVGLEGKGFIKSPAAAKAIKKSTGIDTDNPSPELSENVARLNQKAEIDNDAASKSLKQSVEGDEKGAIDTLEEGKTTPKDLRKLKDLKNKDNLTNAEQLEQDRLEENKQATDQTHKALTDVDPSKDSITSAKKEITDNSTKAKAEAWTNTARSAQTNASKSNTN